MPFLSTLKGANVIFEKVSFLKNFRLGAWLVVPVLKDFNRIQMNKNLSVVIDLKYISQ